MTVIQFKRPDKIKSEGYLFQNEENVPGIVLLQEWWGVNEQIKKVANNLNNLGWRVVIPDLYKGQVALAENEAKHLMNNLNFVDAASQDVRGAVQYLKNSGSKRVAVTGFCMGGALTFENIKIPILGHFAIHDEAFAIQGVEEFEKKLNKKKVNFEFFKYDAKHAFANEEADSKNLPYLQYNEEAKQLAWTRTVTFFNHYLNKI